MITELSLKNYRCFDAQVIPFAPLSILVGRNNAGKSTVVEALRLLSRVLLKYPNMRIQQPPAWLDGQEETYGILPAMFPGEFDFQTVFHRYKDPPAMVEATFSSGDRARVYVGPEGVVYGLVEDRTGAPIHLKKRELKARIPSVQVLPQIGPIARQERILKDDYVRKTMPYSLSSLHFRNEIRLFSELFEQFRNLAENTWEGLRLEELDTPIDEEGVKLALLVRDRDFTAEIAWMGHGLQMWLQIIWFLARVNKDDIVILDEPDVYMHADLQRKLINIVRDWYQQCIVATHSIEIMTEVEAEQIVVIDKSNPRARFANSLDGVQRIIDEVGGLMNVHLTRLFEQRKLLIFEGRDQELLAVFHRKFFPQSADSFLALPSFSIGGWGGWHYAVGSHMFLKNASDETISVYCIFDRDYHPPSAVAHRYKEAERAGVRLHVWKRKEIENYVLVPAAIRRTIQTSASLVGDIPSEREIIEEVECIAADLKNRTFDRLATELLAMDKPRGVAHANQLAREALESLWATFQGRVSVISGKTALSELSAWSQRACGVSLSAKRIAAQLAPREIDAEVKEVITAIQEGRRFQEM